MNLLLLLLALLDDRPRAGIERATTPPSIITIALRLPLVKKGMTDAEVPSVLGVDDYLLRLPCGTLHTQILSYPVRPCFRLTEVYSLDSRRSRYVLDAVTLCWDPAFSFAR